MNTPYIYLCFTLCEHSIFFHFKSLMNILVRFSWCTYVWASVPGCRVCFHYVY